MYHPIRNMLTAQGFTVRGEVKGCDITAIKDETLWVVEMKLSANLTLIYQALDRLAATDWVFVAIPRPRNSRDKHFAKLQKLLKKLQLGLIIVALDSPAQFAEIVIYPAGKDNKQNKKAGAIKKEALARSVDTTGGASKTKINTAFRERNVQIACLLEKHGALTAKALVALGCDKNTGRMFNSNMMGWYQRVEKGVYELSQLGQAYLDENATDTLVVYYRMRAV